MTMSTNAVVNFIRNLQPTSYNYVIQVRAGIQELCSRDIDEVVAYGGLSAVVDVLMSNVITTGNDGQLHRIGFKFLIQVAHKYALLVKITGGGQVAEQVMQVFDDEVVELGDELVRMLVNV
jgi:hypothetical protein